jgi:hypothetical protein
MPKEEKKIAEVYEVFIEPKESETIPERRNRSCRECCFAGWLCGAPPFLECSSIDSYMKVADA